MYQKSRRCGIKCSTSGYIGKSRICANIQQTAVPADVITEQSRLEDGIAQTGYISDSFSEKGRKYKKRIQKDC